MKWLDEIPTAITKNGRLKLIPENSEPLTVEDVSPAFKKIAKRRILNKFRGVLS